MNGTDLQPEKWQLFLTQELGYKYLFIICPVAGTHNGHILEKFYHLITGNLADMHIHGTAMILITLVQSPASSHTLIELLRYSYFLLCCLKHLKLVPKNTRGVYHGLSFVSWIGTPPKMKIGLELKQATRDNGLLPSQVCSK